MDAFQNSNYRMPHSAEFPSQDGENWNDPWKDDPWATPAPSDRWSEKPELVETSFDSAISSAKPEGVDISFDTFVSNTSLATNNRKWFASAEDDPEATDYTDQPLITDSEAFMKLSPPRDTKQNHTVDITLSERLSIVFDDLSSEPTCRVTGLIYAKKASRFCPSSFFLTVRDRKRYVERWEEQTDVCENMTVTVPHLASVESEDQVFRVTMTDADKLEAPILCYSCVPKLKPIPLLLKTKVQRNENGCRIGIRMRANPRNTFYLSQIAILVIVPPDVDGEKVQMSLGGGKWDDMKRIMSWTLDGLKAGEIVDIQARFAYAEGCGPNGTSKFPVLVRCDGESPFSRIDLSATEYSENSTVNLNLTQTSRILYRKV